jgi:hypothetical protein
MIKMKRLFVIVLLFSTVKGFSQYFSFNNPVRKSIDSIVCVTIEYKKRAPAPCSIEMDTYEVPIYMIRVGLYDRSVKSGPEIIKIKLGIQNYYYYARMYNSYNKAAIDLGKLKKAGFCDAFITAAPFDMKGFSFFPEGAGFSNEIIFK